VALADHIVIEDLADFLRRRNDAIARFHQRGVILLDDDAHAQRDAFVADVGSWAGNELAQLVLALAAERAIELGIAAASRTHLGILQDASRRGVTCRQTTEMLLRRRFSASTRCRGVRTSHLSEADNSRILGLCGLQSVVPP